jgi:proline dehydrogenase
MTRAFFLFLSKQRTLRRWMETSRSAHALTKRFVAGQTLDEEIEVCRRLQQQGIFSTLDRLGENVTSLDEAAASRNAYLEALSRIQDSGLPSTVSIKLTQFGLDFSQEACYDNVRQVACRARSAGTSIEIDMESSEYTDRTLDVVTRLHQEVGGVRAVIQAYLRRTRGDIERLCDLKVPIRLCKGAYNEPHSVAFATKAEVDANYRAMTELLFKRGVHPAIASHDEAMINGALQAPRERSVGPEGFEFQMLYGIRRDLQSRLIAGGYRLRLYVPYGEAWYPYFMRRLAERPANVVFLVQNLLHQ